MKKTIFILFTILTISCNNSDETINPTNSNDINLVTGINFRQTFDDPPFELGNPNILVNNMFVIYPNPANLTVFLSSTQNITDVWIVPASPEKIYQDLDFSTILNTNLYNEQSIISNSNFSLTAQSSTNLSLNIGTLATGYYRVFVKIGGNIYWDNLYKNNGSSPEQIAEIVNFWN